MEIIRLTLAEEDLMVIFWESQKPLTSVEILQQSRDKTWTGNYIHKMLRKLENEQFLKVCGMIRYGNRYVRQFTPLVSQEDYTARVLKQQRMKVKSLAKVALALVKDEDGPASGQTSQSLIQELESMIEELRAKENG